MQVKKRYFENMVKKLFILGFAYFLSTNCFAFGHIVTEKESHRKAGHIVFDTIPVDIEELTESADRIFVGTCTEIKEIKNDNIAKVAVTKYSFLISDPIKGVSNKSKISFKQWSAVSRSAGYDLDKKYVLFLHPDSKLGLTSPVGFLQGQFSIVHDEKTDKDFVSNKLFNLGLSKAFKTKGINYIDQKYIRKFYSINSDSGKPIEYREFIKTVKTLVKSQGGEQ